jgi:hypothetical protein
MVFWPKAFAFPDKRSICSLCACKHILVKGHTRDRQRVVRNLHASWLRMLKPCSHPLAWNCNEPLLLDEQQSEEFLTCTFFFLIGRLTGLYPSFT